MFRNLIMFVTIMGYVSCSSVAFKESDLGTDTKLTFTTFNPKPGVDIYDALRVDLVRQYKTVTSTDANGNQMTRRERVADHPAGIELGNGLFLDANQNLVLSLIDVLDLRKKENFEVTLKQSGFLSGDRILKKEGKKVTFDSGALIGSSTEYLVSPNAVTIKGGTLGSDTLITYDNDSVTYDPKGFLGGLSKFTIQRTGNNFTSPGLIWDNVFKFDGKGDQIKVGDSIELQNKKTQMEMKTSDSSYTFYKTKSTYLMIDSKGKGVKVTINGKSVKIIYNGYWSTSEVELIVE
jgi:hypothetical protein